MRLSTRQSTDALVLAETLWFMAALAAVRASTAGAAVHLALGASLFGHGSDLVDAVKRGVLRDLGISILPSRWLSLSSWECINVQWRRCRVPW